MKRSALFVGIGCGENSMEIIGVGQGGKGLPVEVV